MKIYQCYLCNDLLGDTNRSIEHILLNSMGGRLKSSELLCKDCNSQLGHDSDAALSKQFEFFAAYLQVKRDSGKTPTIKGGKTNDGTEYHLLKGSKPILAKPVFNVTDSGKGIEYSLTARNEKEMQTMLNGIKKSHPYLDVTDAMSKINVKKARLKEPIRYTLEFGGDLAFQSILKTAVNFYIYKNGNHDFVRHLYEMIKGKEQLDIVKHFYPRKPVYKKEANEVIHLLHLYGNKHDKLLYCFVEFFSMQSFLVILSTNYPGPNISHTYAYDVITGLTQNKVCKLKLRPSEISTLPTAFSSFQEVTIKANRVMKIASKIHSDQEISNITRRAAKDVFETKYAHEKLMTPQMIDEFIEQVTTDFVDFMYAGMKDEDEP